MGRRWCKPAKPMKATRSCLRWTHEEDRILSLAWGEFGIATIAKRLGRGRSFASIQNRARRLGLAGGRHGLIRITTIARDTGYDRETIVTAIGILGLSLQQLPATDLRQQYARRRGLSRGHWGLDEEHLDVLLAYLKRKPERVITDRPGLKKGRRGLWGPVHGYACVACHETTHPHYAKGLCVRCYDRARPVRAWGDKGLPLACEMCGTNERTPYVGGLCKRCYAKSRRTKAGDHAQAAE